MTEMPLIVTIVPALTAHVLESTLVVALVAALALAFRRNRAQVRYSLWRVASVKFLVPFDVLVWLGNRFPIAPAFDVVRVERTMVLATGDQPVIAPLPDVPAFLEVPAAPAIPEWLLPLAAAAWLCGAAVVLATWWVRWRRVGRLASQAHALADGREVAILRRLEQQAGTMSPLPLLVSDASVEPGVFGIVRQVLLWPRGISDRFSDEQIEAVLAHEVSHAGRRDNLWAALHAVVQALFWFNPMVWWVGGRLVHERERACDEDVIRLGNQPQTYAESILRTCQFYVEAPVACVAGVTGAGLKQRIEAIMRNRPVEAVNGWRRGLLFGVASMALAAPIASGMLNPPLEARTVTPSRVDVRERKVVFHRPDGPFRVENFTVAELIRTAYALPDARIVGAPAWLDAERFDIEMAWDTEPGAQDVHEMMRNLLALEFKLTTHVEQRVFPAYALRTVNGDRLGPQLRPSRTDCTTAQNTGVLGVTPCQLRKRFDAAGGIYASGVTMAQFVNDVTSHVPLDRPLVDRTGLDGRFDLDLVYQRGPHRGPARLNEDRAFERIVTALFEGLGYPSFFTALERQLGLRLVEETAPIDVLVIDRVERP